jgi:hypothetical protein
MMGPNNSVEEAVNNDDDARLGHLLHQDVVNADCFSDIIEPEGQSFTSTDTDVAGAQDTSWDLMKRPGSIKCLENPEKSDGGARAGQQEETSSGESDLCKADLVTRILLQQPMIQCYPWLPPPDEFGVEQ